LILPGESASTCARRHSVQKEAHCAPRLSTRMPSRVARLDQIAHLVDAAFEAVAAVNSDIADPTGLNRWQSTGVVSTGTLYAIRHLARNEADSIKFAPEPPSRPKCPPLTPTPPLRAECPPRTPTPPLRDEVTPGHTSSPRARVSLRRTITASRGITAVNATRRPLRFVNRNTLISFTDLGVKYFKEHWSASVIDGVHHSTAVDSLLKGVPGLAALLSDIRKNLDLSSKTVVAISLAPADASAVYTDACILHLGADFARIVHGSSSGGSASDALVIHLAPMSEGSEGKRTRTTAAAAA